MMKLLPILVFAVQFAFAQAPPGARIPAGNSSGATVSTPTYNNDTGSYVTTVSVTISDATGGAAIIYCTATGSDCSPVGGTTYSVPVVITVTATHLCSYATHAGMTDSATKCGTYTITTGGGGITAVAAPACVGHATSAVISAVNNTGANLFVLSVSSTSGATSISDSVNSTTGWTLVAAAYNGVNPPAAELWYNQNPGVSSSQTITVNGGFVAACFVSFSGMVTTSVLETSVNRAQTTSGTSTFQVLSITPGSGNQLVISAVGHQSTSGSVTIDSGFTATTILQAGGTNYGGGIGYLIQSGGAAQNPTWTNSSGLVAWGGVNGTFQGL